MSSAVESPGTWSRRASRGNAMRGAAVVAVLAAVGVTLYAKRAQIVTRAEVGAIEPAPIHGVIDHWYSMNGDGRIVVDFDASTVRVTVDTMEQKSDRTQPLGAPYVRDLEELADATWREPSSGDPRRMDAFESLTILDGDDAFTVSASTIAGDDKRPAASRLARVLSSYSR